MEQEMHSAEEAREKEATLPPEVKKMLYSAEMSAIIQKIGQKHELHIDQLDLLNAEAGQVMLGFIEPQDFPESVSEMLKIDITKANAIAQDVNELLFAQIREAMKGVSVSSAVQSAPTQPATPTEVSPTPTAPKREFPAADVMLMQKTVTAPISASGAGPAHEAITVVPPKLVPMTTPPPAMPKAPGTFVTTPAQPVPPVAHTTPPITTLPPKIPSGPAPTLVTPSIAPTQPIPPVPAPATPLPPTSASTPTLPTPPSASVTSSPTPPTPPQNAYKTDPYREPIE